MTAELSRRQESTAVFLIGAINLLLVFVTGVVVVEAQTYGRSAYVAGGIALLCWAFIDFCLYRLERLRRQHVRQEEEERQRRTAAGGYYVVVRPGHLPTPEEKTVAAADDGTADGRRSGRT